MRGEFFKVDSVIDICTDVMNLRSVSYECKCKLEEIKDDYKIEVSFLGQAHWGWSWATVFDIV